MLRIIKILLGILGGLFWTALMLSFADTKTAVMTIISALLHEAGHISALVMIKKKFSLPKLVASGFRIKTESSLSYKEEIIICAAGPLTNIIIFVFCLPHTPFFAVINLATAISNLLLLPGYDGYKITSDIISMLLGNEKSDVLMPHFALITCAVGVFLSLFLILLLNGGYWIFFVFFIVLLRQIFFLNKQTKNESF